MRGPNVTPRQEGLAGGSTSYARFIVLSDARSGSSMLCDALNSSPDIRCFREVFNWKHNYVDFEMEGYDNYSSRDLSLRKRDLSRFLRERIFCQHGDEVRAVGFKFHYVHAEGFSGLLERLVEDTELRVLHLRRRNLLRQLVSRKIAEGTGVWRADPRRTFRLANLLRAARHPLRETGALRRTFTLTNLLRATRHPVWAASALWRRMRGPNARKAPPLRVNVSVEELSTFIARTESTIADFDEHFREHPKLTLFYEDIVSDRENVFNRAQAFLGVPAGPLTVTLKRQNPEPLRQLLENYDELYEAFRDTPHAGFFD